MLLENFRTKLPRGPEDDRTFEVLVDVSEAQIDLSPADIQEMWIWFMLGYKSSNELKPDFIQLPEIFGAFVVCIYEKHKITPKLFT